MSTKPTRGLSLSAWRAFHKIRTTLLPPLVRHLNEECSLSEAEFQVFAGLSSSENGQLKPSQLAEELGWDLPRLSHQVSRMESKGLLVKQQCPVDARSCWIGATEEGKKLFQRAFPIQMKEVDRLFSAALTAEQMKALIEISAAIEAHVKKSQTH